MFLKVCTTSCIIRSMEEEPVQYCLWVALLASELSFLLSIIPPTNFGRHPSRALYGEGHVVGIRGRVTYPFREVRPRLPSFAELADWDEALTCSRINDKPNSAKF